MKGGTQIDPLEARLVALKTPEPKKTYIPPYVGMQPSAPPSTKPSYLSSPAPPVPPPKPERYTVNLEAEPLPKQSRPVPKWQGPAMDTGAKKYQQQTLTLSEHRLHEALEGKVPECKVSLLTKVIIVMILIVFVIISVVDTGVDVADAGADTFFTTFSAGLASFLGIATNTVDLIVELALELLQLALVLWFNWLVPEDYQVPTWAFIFIIILGAADVGLTLLGFAPYADWAEVVGEVPSEAIQCMIILYYGLSVVVGC